jgi:hypothetical protein
MWRSTQRAPDHSGGLRRNFREAARVKCASLKRVGNRLPFGFEIGSARRRRRALMKVIQVIVLATFHMSNPGHDLHNQTVDDMLAPARQTQIEAVTAALARFAPTRVVVEWPEKTVDERYPKYLAGTLPPSRNEVVQLGFRLAKMSKAEVQGVDVDGDFPFDKVAGWAAAHGRKEELAAIGAEVDRELAEQSRALQQGGVAAELRMMNEPARIDAMHSKTYRKLLQYGSGDVQPGADLLTAWYRRNFLICARLAQSVKDGDRVVVLYGAGHARLLRECVEEMPGWKLVEANSFLP